MAIPYTNQNTSTRNGNGPNTTDRTNINGSGSAVPENPTVGVSYNISRSVYWTPEEQSQLKKLFTNKHSSPNLVKRYAKIVLNLQEKKTLNDVALRYRWMIKTRNGKQRRKDDSFSSKEKSEKAAYQQVKPSSHATNHSSGVRYAQLSNSMDGDECIDDEISYQAIGGDQALNQISANGSALKGKAAYQQVKRGMNHAESKASMDSDEDIDDDKSYKAIGGSVVQLLEQNEQAMNQISANISAFKVHGNKDLIYQMINNIDALMNESLNDMPEMEQSTRQRYDFSMVRRLKFG